MKAKKWLIVVFSLVMAMCVGLGVAACKNEPKKHVHDYSEWAYDGAEHWKECPVDEAADESTREEHTMVDGKCTVCPYQEAPAAHVHKYTKLVSDATNHWYECPDDNDYITQFGHVYENGKCIVCGKEGTAPADVELDERKWYVVGNGAGSLLSITWEKLTGELTKATQPDSNGYTVYTRTLDLYAGDQFKFVQDLDWDEGLGYYSLSEVANTAGVFQDGGTGNIKLMAGQDGTYQFIIRTKPDLGPTSVMVEFRLVEALEPLNVEEQFDMYIIGHLHCTGALDNNTQWSKDPGYMVKMNLMADGETFYTVVELYSNDEFKVYNLRTNAYFPDGTGNNLKPPKTTLYVVTWKIGDASPVWEEYHHVHNYSEYKHDANEHWCVCVQDGEMDETHGKAAHEFGDDNFCDVCGYEKAEKPECETHTWGTDNVCTVCGRHWVYTEGLRYRINEKKDGYYVVGVHEDTDPATIKELVIPQYYNGKPVVGILDKAFYDGTATNPTYSGITKVVLPDTVKTIGQDAFRKLVNLTSLKLGAGLEEIGDSAFRECRYARAINLPEGLKTIGANAFSNIWFTEITVPASVTAIGNNAFEATYLTDLKFAEGSKLATIGASAFSGCAYLKEVALPETVTSVGASAFAGCSSLTSLTLPTAAPWKYAASTSTADWIALGDTAADPAAAATWIKAHAANYLMITEAHEHNFKLGFNGTQHWYRCTICDALEAAKQAHKIFDMQCSVCGFEHTEHTYSTTSWASDETGHWRACPLDGAVEPGTKVAHTWNTAGTMCTVCRFRHTHTYADNWSYDETNHWKDATCGHEVKNGNAAHRFNDENVCPTCGYERIVQGENNGTPNLAFEFNEDYTGLIVTGFKEAPASLTVIEIPAKCGNWPVVELGDSAAAAFKPFASTVTKVVIPDTVKVVRAKMFQNFTVLSDLTIGSSVYKMGDYVFQGCTSLQSVALPESLYQIGAYAFDGCTALKTINLENLTKIGDYGFRKCSQLDNIKFNEGLKQLGGYTFQNCTALKHADFSALKELELGSFVQLAPGVTTSAGQVFENCGFETLTLPDNLVASTRSNFKGCASLKSVTFGKNTRFTSEDTFKDCVLLDTINLENISIIYSGTFDNCAFTTLTFDFDAFTNLYGSGFFTNCKQLKTVTIKGTYSKSPNQWNYFCQGCTALTSVTLPDSLTAIPTGFFSGCTSLTQFTIPANFTAIGAYAFQNCSKITTIAIPAKVTTIGNYTFNGCSLLATVDFGTAQITSIGNYAFQNCAVLKTLAIPATVTSIGTYAFKGCSLLDGITLPAGLTSLGNYAFQNCTSLKSIAIPEKVASIGNYTFDGCTSLATVDLSKATIKSIGQYAFQSCALTTVTIPDTVTTIDTRAFSKCASLATVNLGAGVKTIGQYAFNGCTSLTQITIPAQVKTISVTAFRETGLTSVTFVDKEDWFLATSSSGTTTLPLPGDISDPAAAAALLKDNTESTSRYFMKVPQA